MDILLFNNENLKGIADNLKIKVEELTTTLNDIKNNSGDIKSVWSSDAQINASEKIDTFFKSADEFNAKALVYIEFLNKAISEYEKSDSSIPGGR